MLPRARARSTLRLPPGAWRSSGRTRAWPRSWRRSPISSPTWSCSGRGPAGRGRSPRSSSAWSSAPSYPRWPGCDDDRRACPGDGSAGGHDPRRADAPRDARPRQRGVRPPPPRRSAGRGSRGVTTPGQAGPDPPSARSSPRSGSTRRRGSGDGEPCVGPHPAGPGLRAAARRARPPGGSVLVDRARGAPGSDWRRSEGSGAPRRTATRWARPCRSDVHTTNRRDGASAHPTVHPAGTPQQGRRSGAQGPQSHARPRGGTGSNYVDCMMRSRLPARHPESGRRSGYQIDHSGRWSKVGRSPPPGAIHHQARSVPWFAVALRRWSAALRPGERSGPGRRRSGSRRARPSTRARAR